MAELSGSERRLRRRIGDSDLTLPGGALFPTEADRGQSGKVA